MSITPQIIEVALYTVRGKAQLMESLTSIVLSEKYTLTLVEALYDENGQERSPMLSINKITGEIKMTKRLLSMSDQCVFFWIIWSVLWLEDESRNKQAADEKAFRALMAKFKPPYFDFIIEFGTMIDGEAGGSDKRVTPLMNILEVYQNGNRRKSELTR